jgi:hypothetical protein
MAFILSTDLTEDAKDNFVLLESRFVAYREYLESVRESLPLAAYEFAVAEWHYNPEHHQCPHDAWVESLVITEPFSGERREKRNLEINLRLLGAYHDGYIDLKYQNVRSYSLETPAGFKMRPLNVGHGDWLTDEVRLSESGKVAHEIEFSRGSRWLIECGDIVYQWSSFER